MPREGHRPTPLGPPRPAWLRPLIAHAAVVRCLRSRRRPFSRALASRGSPLPGLLEEACRAEAEEAGATGWRRAPWRGSCCWRCRSSSGSRRSGARRRPTRRSCVSSSTRCSTRSNSSSARSSQVSTSGSRSPRPSSTCRCFCPPPTHPTRPASPLLAHPPSTWCHPPPVAIVDVQVEDTAVKSDYERRIAELQTEVAGAQRARQELQVPLSTPPSPFGCFCACL